MPVSNYIRIKYRCGDYCCVHFRHVYLSPISSKHMAFCCPFLDPHLTTHHSNITVQLEKVTTKGPHTLQLGCLSWVLEDSFMMES